MIKTYLNNILIEIISSRTPQQMNAVKACYQKKYSRNLEADVKKETSGTLQKILITLSQGKRSVNNSPNQAQCAQIAKEILNAGESKIGTDESVFNKYFGLYPPMNLLVLLNIIINQLVTLF